MSNASGSGALPPPAGVAPNFTHHLPALKGVSIFFVIMVTISTIMRLYMRYISIKGVSYSSDTMILAYLTYMVYYALGWRASRYGSGNHQWDIPVTDMPEFAHWSWIVEVFYTPCISMIRLTLCIQFMELFVVYRGKRFWVLTVFISINMAYYISQLFVTIFQCRPVAKVWKPQLPGSCLSRPYQRLLIATGFFNLAGDILMLAFPLYCVWGLENSLKQRLATAGLFTVGLLAIAASTLRVAFSFFYNNGSTDPTFTLLQVGQCTDGELTAGILVANLVWLPGFLKHVNVKARFWITKYRARRGSLSGFDSRDDA